jgi:hypothetical protein
MQISIVNFITSFCSSKKKKKEKNVDLIGPSTRAKEIVNQT